MGKTRIVLDADVLIHFAKGDSLSVVPKIFPEYTCVVLSAVYEELGSIRTQLDKEIAFFHDFAMEAFNPTSDMLREYARLRKDFGKGESACMAYCRFTNNVIGSSNLRDIKEYCEDNKIAYVTTMDFLYYAYARKVMSAEECNEIIRKVRSKGSKLPDIDIERYHCKVAL